MSGEPTFGGPVERAPIAEVVARRILDRVVAGALRPGDQLPPERELALALGVSRPSVREAIRGLSILGVVRARQGGGAHISALDADAILGPIRFFLSLDEVNIEELYDARALIEGDVARRAATSISEAALEELGVVLAAQAGTLGNPRAFRVSDHRFHELIWIGSGNAFLKRIGESLNALGLEFRRRASERPEVLRQSLRDHRRLLERLRERDPDGAAAAAEAHMRNVYRSTVAQEQGR